MLIIGCSKGRHIAQKVAKKAKTSYSELGVNKFPDGEIKVRIIANVSNKTVVLIQSFYENVNDCIIEVIFAAKTARDLNAKKIFLVAPYFPYLRQDKRFNSGECISIEAIADIISKYFDGIYIIDPHLHRQKSLSNLFSIKAEKLTANPLIAEYIQKNIKNPLIVGPDWESYKWARHVAEEIKCSYAILEKKRYSGRKVKVTLNKKIDMKGIKGKNIVFVDDIISTGNTILETAKKLRKLGAKKFICIGIHGILVENALQKLKKANINLITTNTIQNKTSKIDVSGLVAKYVKP
ncbi:ribose-phosphate diphosphokinase [Candidatus Woesearchaeota archaeon]|nr:ribose-phosphate diphosphokinase [Candidatus Woesearchaeota archaeon]